MLRSPFIGAPSYSDAFLTEFRGTQIASQHDADFSHELRAAADGPTIFDRSDRGLVVVRGRDRQTWLHNLVTNAIKPLSAGQGCYSFALDVKGRIQFDFNVLCRTDELWLDIDRLALPAAVKHLDMRLITEDARMTDESDRYARLGVAEPHSTKLAELVGAPVDLRQEHKLAIGDVEQMPREWDRISTDSENWRGANWIRSAFSGLSGFELIVPITAAHVWWRYFAEIGAAKPVGSRALDVLRIQAGIPWLGRDLDDRVLPAETGQVERAVTFNKGCYLGQEVVERMRSRGAVAKKLVRVVVGDGSSIATPIELKHDGVECGRLTSLAWDPLAGQWIGLAYVKSALSHSAALTAGDQPVRIS